MRLDHVVFAVPDLDSVSEAADRVGLTVEYGGAHPDANTEMALLTLGDGTYVEFLAGTGGDPGWWPAHVEAGAGPADWCLRVRSVGETLVRSVRAGLAVRGPRPGTRDRPDGRRLEWDLGWHLGSGLPFCLADRTPREWRVGGGEGAGESPASVAEVVLAATGERADELVASLRRRWRLPTPTPIETPLDAEVRTVPGAPLSIAVPAEGSELAARTDRFGAGPCAYLLDGDSGAFSTADPEPWGDGTVGWLDDPLFEGRLGIRSA